MLRSNGHDLAFGQRKLRIFDGYRGYTDRRAAYGDDGLMHRGPQHHGIAYRRRDQADADDSGCTEFAAVAGMAMPRQDAEAGDRKAQHRQPRDLRWVGGTRDSFESVAGFLRQPRDLAHVAQVRLDVRIIGIEQARALIVENG